MRRISKFDGVKVNLELHMKVMHPLVSAADHL